MVRFRPMRVASDPAAAAPKKPAEQVSVKSGGNRLRRTSARELADGRLVRARDDEHDTNGGDYGADNA